eukprot:GHVN01004491.1.p2 GENE.GHVN01004491.1~~GHVN01004491.1.p2  ORF type:complete len:113 (+),score=6.78 GHVN01004491.1:1012-1350(+)
MTQDPKLDRRRRNVIHRRNANLLHLENPGIYRQGNYIHIVKDASTTQTPSDDTEEDWGSWFLLLPETSDEALTTPITKTTTNQWVNVYNVYKHEYIHDLDYTHPSLTKNHCE